MESGAAGVAVSHISALLVRISGPPQHVVLLILAPDKSEPKSHLAESLAAVNERL